MSILRHPLLCGSVPTVLAGLLVVAAAVAQTRTPRPLTRPAPPTLLSQFDVSAGTVQLLDVAADAAGQYTIPVVLAGALRTIRLQPHEVRGAGFQLLVQDASSVQPMATPPCVTYRGILLEEPDSAVVATIVAGSLEAVVYCQPKLPGQPGDSWVVQPIRHVDPSAGPSAHVVYRADDSVPLPYVCGNVTPQSPPALPNAGVDNPRECEIAIEADLQFYQANGSSVTTTQNDIASIVNQMDFIYDRDCDVTFTVTTILVTTTAVYTTNDPSLLLDEFSTNWMNTHAGIQRDVAHLFTGRNLSGSTIGIGWLSSICNSGYGYALSQSRFSTNFNRRVGLTSHEVGHNFSATHCDGISPCYIMCATLAGCSNNVTLFSPVAIGQITGFAATRPCMNPPATMPTLTAASPASVAVFDPSAVTLTGTGLSTVTSFRIGSQSYFSGFSIAGDTSMTIQVPRGTALGLTSVSVTNSLGTSNLLPLAYTTTSPPALWRPGVILSTGGTARFDFAGEPGRVWFLVLDLNSATSPFQGYDLLGSPMVLGMGLFPAPLGIEVFTIPVPAGLGYLPVYSQLLEANVAPPVATGVSNIGVTILL